MSMTRVSIYRIIMCSVLTSLLLFQLTGCMLLPKEEEERKVTFVKSDELQQYTFISPERIDLEKTVDIPCVYRQLEELNLGFQLDDHVVKGVYVNVRDAVKKGTLLAELEIGEMGDELKAMENEIESAKNAIEQIKLQASNDKENVELEYKYKHITKVEYNQRISEIQDNVKAATKEKEDAIYILNLRLKEKQDIISSSKIYAPIDGVISYVKTNLLDSMSEENIGVIKMIDPEKCAFEIYVSEDSTYLKEGETYTVEANGLSYEGVILGSDQENPSYIYLQMKEVPMNLEVGTSGAIRYLVDSRKDALVLPSKIIHEGEGFNFVYIVGDDNIKKIQKVEVGLKTEEYAEIVSGLEEDDYVINE